jgi:hypothetical protein
MNYKVAVDENDYLVHITVGVTGELNSLESRTGDWLGRILPCPCAINGDSTDSRSLHPWLVAEGFVANSDDCACVGETHGKNTTFIFKARWIPEKWASKKIVKDKEPELVASQKSKFKKRKKLT